MTPNQPNYCIQKPNSTAVNVIRAWLIAGGYTTKVPIEHDVDLILVGSHGQDIDIIVHLKENIEHIKGVCISGNKIIGKNPAEAYKEYYKILEAGGYPLSPPVNRGVPVLKENGNIRKLHYRDEDFLVGIRHNEFRRSPNPPIDRWKQYKSTMESVARAFMQRNYRICLRHSLEFSDLMQYAYCYIVNFCAQYETPTPKHFDNERKAYRYLQQRFRGDLLKVLLKKERSIMPDRETVQIAAYALPGTDTEVSPDPTDAYIHALNNKSDLDRARNSIIDNNLEDLPDFIGKTEFSKKGARGKLDELLSLMKHSEMIKTLTKACKNTDLDRSTRKESALRLAKHEVECKVCNPLFDPVLIPQANDLSKIKVFLRNALSGVSPRQVCYYELAAISLNLASPDGSITSLGSKLLASSSVKDEIAVFCEAIENSETMSHFRWFFKHKDKGMRELTEFIMANFGLAESTADRRAKALLRWRTLLF